jgi:hypothetical protein
MALADDTAAPDASNAGGTKMEKKNECKGHKDECKGHKDECKGHKKGKKHKKGDKDACSGPNGCDGKMKKDAAPAPAEAPKSN